MTETLTKSWDGITLREKMCDVGSLINMQANAVADGVAPSEPDPEGYWHRSHTSALLFDWWERSIRHKDYKDYKSYVQRLSTAWRDGDDDPRPHVITDIHTGTPTLYWRTSHPY